MDTPTSFNDLIALSHEWLPMISRYGAKVLLALVALVIGWWLIGRLSTRVTVLLQKSHADQTLQTFIASLISLTLKVLLLVNCISMVGIQTTSFIAMIGAAGLAVGLALQGSLSNFAGGVLILIFRPFKVGDSIEALGVSGTVDSIQIFHTTLRTSDNRTIIIPNGSLSNGLIINVARQSTRRSELVFWVPFDCDLEDVRNTVLKLSSEDARMINEPAPAVFTPEMSGEGIKVVLFVCTKSSDAFSVSCGLYEKSRSVFLASGLSLAVPPKVLP